jgi:DNA-binding protein YbaB
MTRSGEWDFIINDPVGNPDESLEGFDEKMAELKRRAELAREKVGEVTAVGRSSDGSVAVLARAGGQIVDVQVTDQALKLTPTKLGEAFKSAALKAQNAAAEASLEVLTEYVGESEATEQLKTVFHPHEGELEEDEPSDSWSANTRQFGSNTDDDDDQGPHGPYGRGTR